MGWYLCPLGQQQERNTPKHEPAVAAWKSNQRPPANWFLTLQGITDRDSNNTDTPCAQIHALTPFQSYLQNLNQTSISLILTVSPSLAHMLSTRYLTERHRKWKKADGKAGRVAAEGGGGGLMREYSNEVSDII